MACLLPLSWLTMLLLERPPRWQGLRAGRVRYGSQTPIFKERSLQDQNYDGRKEC